MDKYLNIQPKIKLVTLKSHGTNSQKTKPSCFETRNVLNNGTLGYFCQKEV